MTTPPTAPIMIEPRHLFAEGTDGVPIWLVRNGTDLPLEAAAKTWLESTRFRPAARKQIFLPGIIGAFGGVALGLGNGAQGEPCGPSELLVGQLVPTLVPGTYRIANAAESEASTIALAWGLGAYRFRRYKSDASEPPPQLAWPAGADRARVLAEIEGVWLGRDLINTPASDMGPEDIENAARDLAMRHGAEISVIAGDDLQAQNFPLIHAVGRASTRPPRLIDLTWGAESDPKVTLVGKGIAFDTGGLDIKPSSGMLLMKKDMGGAAVALAVAHMVMACKLKVRLRVIIAAAENSISGNAFRPSDVIKSRLGPTVEIGNTDAEGRLVLADALALADEESPRHLFTFATLTGAARVALGPDLPALFCDDDQLADALYRSGLQVGDPVWRLPFWPGYDRNIDSDVADMNNVSESPFSGAIIAALFLKRFVKRASRYAHLDLYGWRPAARPLGPKGGEPQTARSVFDVLSREYAA